MSTILSNYVLACVQVKKMRGSALNLCCSSIGGSALHRILKLPGEHCSPKNSGSASTNTTSATGCLIYIYIKQKTAKAV